MKSPFYVLAAGVLIIILMTVLIYGQDIHLSTAHPQFIVTFGALFSVLFVFLPDILLRNENGQRHEQILKLRSVIGLSLLLNALGEIGLYQLYLKDFEYDKLSHFLISLLLSVALAEILWRWTRIQHIRVFWLTASALFIAGIIWEGLEAFSDKVFRTQVWGVEGLFVTSDTLRDIVANCLGILMAILILSKHQQRESDAFLLQNRVVLPIERRNAPR